MAARGWELGRQEALDAGQGWWQVENDNFSPDEQQRIKYLQERPDAYWGSSSTTTCQEMCSKE